MFQFYDPLLTRTFKFNENHGPDGRFAANSAEAVDRTASTDPKVREANAQSAAATVASTVTDSQSGAKMKPVIDALMANGYKEITKPGGVASGARSFHKDVGDENFGVTHHFVMVDRNGKWNHSSEGMHEGKSVSELNHIADSPFEGAPTGKVKPDNVAAPIGIHPIGDPKHNPHPDDLLDGDGLLHADGRLGKDGLGTHPHNFHPDDLLDWEPHAMPSPGPSPRRPEVFHPGDTGPTKITVPPEKVDSKYRPPMYKPTTGGFHTDDLLGTAFVPPVAKTSGGPKAPSPKAPNWGGAPMQRRTFGLMGMR